MTTMPSLPLSTDFVHTIIDNVLASPRSISLSEDNEKILFCRVKTPHDWNSLSHSLPPTDLSKRNKIGDESGNATLSADVRTPFYFGIKAVWYDAVKHEEKLVGFCTFYIAYSSWDGRMLYVDQINIEKDCSPSLYQIVAEIATGLCCHRFTWKQKEPPKWKITSVQPEYLDDLVFLSMDRLAMANFIESPSIESSMYQSPLESNGNKMKSFLFLYIEDTIRETLVQQTVPKQGSNIKLRLAGSEDTERIARLVKLLAIHAQEADAVNMTAEDYLMDAYHSTEPLFYCILADVVTTDQEEEDEEDGIENAGPRTTVAMGLFYFGHNLVDGPFLYLEDLFCEEAHRGKGIGTAIMKQLAHISLALDCSKFIWQALDWDTPALSFYNKIGATIESELKVTRFCGNDLESFAQSKHK